MSFVLPLILTVTFIAGVLMLLSDRTDNFFFKITLIILVLICLLANLIFLLNADQIVMQYNTTQTVLDVNNTIQNSTIYYSVPSGITDIINRFFYFIILAVGLILLFLFLFLIYHIIISIFPEHDFLHLGGNKND